MKTKTHTPDNSYQNDLIKLLTPPRPKEKNPDLEEKIGVISKSQSDQFMRLNGARFFERVSVMPAYINLAYKTLMNKNNIDICNCFKEVSSIRKLQNKKERKK